MKPPHLCTALCQKLRASKILSVSLALFIAVINNYVIPAKISWFSLVESCQSNSGSIRPTQTCTQPHGLWWTVNEALPAIESHTPWPLFSRPGLAPDKAFCSAWVKRFGCVNLKLNPGGNPGRVSEARARFPLRICRLRFLVPDSSPPAQGLARVGERNTQSECRRAQSAI